MNLPRSLCVALLLSGAVMAQDPDPSPTASPKSAEPIADGTSEFNHLDVDRDGWLSESEVKVHPLPLPEFVLIDADGDGKVSSAEWNDRDKVAISDEDE
jgi:hypothetical protein